MDIAEIRKKAKETPRQPERNGQSVEGTQLEQGVESSPTPESLAPVETAPAVAEPTAEQTPAEVSTELAAVQAESVGGDAFEQGLDRLFSTDNSFDLATDSYNDALEGNRVQTQETVRQYLAFNLGSEEYALDISHISEIIKIREFTDIPRSPEFLLGIISLRGVVVPVFDLRRRFRLGESVMLNSSRIVVCRHDDVTVGLLVDCINQVVSLADETIEPPPTVLSGFDRDMVLGVGRYQERMLILLNLQSVLDIDSSQMES